MAEKKIPYGFWFERRNNAPDFIIGRMSIKLDKAIPFLEENKNESGYVNLTVLKSKTDGFYIELDEWKPTKKEDAPAADHPVAPSNPLDKTKLNEVIEKAGDPKDIPF